MYDHRYKPKGLMENPAFYGQSTSRKTNSLQYFLAKRSWRVLGLVLALIFLVFRFLPARSQTWTEADLLILSKSSPSQGSSSLTTSRARQDNRPIPPNVDWTQYAYSQYVTGKDHVCQAVMFFESLAGLDSRADRIMLYPEEWDFENWNDNISQLLIKAREEYSVKLVPVQLWRYGGGTWADGFTKFLAFNQTQYKRVLALDSDATILQDMDELFFLPPTRIALCHGYWYPELSFSGQLMLVEPSVAELNRILESLQSERLEDDWDTEILNRLYWHDALYLPSRPYDLITRDFRHLAPDHYGYLGNRDEVWNPDKILAEAKYVHFSDWPFPKPWIEPTQQEIEENQPTCLAVEGSSELDCRDREKWLWIYKDFGDRRERVCGARYYQNL